ncbi:MAG: DNA polymerase I [Bacteroidales bacterium]|nr:DNA polymerase I [Bacteroidales bacterium]
MDKEKKLFLLDAMALIYRAFYALNKNPRINSKGLNTSAILGFTNTLYEIIKKEKPSHIAVVFDTMAPTIRKEGFAEYKGTRQKMPEDIAISLPYIKAIIEAFNIPVIFSDGYEADDVIGTLAKKAEKKDFTVYMMTSDKDFYQLVSENIFVYKPARMGNKAEKIGVKEVCEKYEIDNPKQFIDMLGLWGDAVDNIPGIPGIGQKRAQELIKKFGNMENLIENSNKLKGKMKENVVKYAEQGLISKQLATIILDVPIEFDENQLKLKTPNVKQLKALFNELEFKNLAKRILTDISVNNASNKQPDLFSDVSGEIESLSDNIKNKKHNYFLIDTYEKKKSLISELLKQKSFCFDTETTGLDVNKAELVGISFSYKKWEAYYIPLPEHFDEAYKILQDFKPVFENSEIEKIGQNIKFDILMLKNYNIDVKGKLFDTMLAHYLIEPDMRHNMDFLAETYLNYKPVPIETLIGKKGKNQLNMRSIQTTEPEKVKEYAAEDADITLQLKEVLLPILEKTNTKKLFDEIEMPLIPVLTSMQFEGVKINPDTLKKYSFQLEEEIAELEKNIYKIAGIEFNISSPKQLGEVLFEHLKITDKPKLTKTKQYSTGEDVLHKLIKKHKIIPLILDYRSLTKLKSTYVDALPLLINQKTGRIHPSYNQAVAATGRLSSKNPNIQNIPIRTERGREIRKAFVPKNEDYTLLSADYSQVELRIIAHLSKDENMINAFLDDQDIHSATASKIFNVDIKDVTKDMRRKAKTVNFGIIYGISAFGLSQRLEIQRKEAAGIIEQYFTKYPLVKKYMDDTIDFARENGYVETIMKRRRYLRDINSANATVRGFAERNAINAPIQGSSADMIKIAMINIFNEFNKLKLKSKMIIQVHDELVFDVYKKELDIVKNIISDKMINAIKMDVPLKIDMNYGSNWLEAH